MAGNPERWHELVAELHPFDIHKLNIVLQRLFVNNLEFGYPRLKEHLAAVTALMRAALNWDTFKRALQRALPKKNITIPLALDDD